MKMRGCSGWNLVAGVVVLASLAQAGLVATSTNNVTDFNSVTNTIGAGRWSYVWQHDLGGGNSEIIPLGDRRVNDDGKVSWDVGPYPDAGNYMRQVRSDGLVYSDCLCGMVYTADAADAARPLAISGTWAPTGNVEWAGIIVKILVIHDGDATQINFGAGDANVTVLWQGEWGGAAGWGPDNDAYSADTKTFNLSRVSVNPGDDIVFTLQWTNISGDGGARGWWWDSKAYLNATLSPAPVEVESRTGRIDTTPNGGLDLVLQNGGVHVNGNIYKHIILSGTVSNWTGYTDANWAGTWGFISLLGSDYFINRNVPAVADETMNVFSYAGDANYGDVGKQRGFGANGGLVLWKNGYWDWSGQVNDAFAAEDTSNGTAGHKTDMARNSLADPSQFEYEVVYNLEAMTMTVSVRDVGDIAWDTTATVALGLRNITGNDDWSDVVTSVQMADNLTAVGGTTYGFDYTVQMKVANPVSGDANMDGKVDVSDLGILAANYGTTVGAKWTTGDFNGDGNVDVSDLGILAANYGTGTGSSLDFNADAKALGLTAEAKEETPVTSTLGCGSAALPLIAGLLLMGVFLTRLEE